MNILTAIGLPLAFKNYLNAKKKYDRVQKEAKYDEASLLAVINNYNQARNKVFESIDKTNSSLDSFDAKNESPNIKVIPILHIVESDYSVDYERLLRVRIELVFQSLSPKVTSYIVDSDNVGRGLTYSIAVDGKDVFFGSNCPFGFTLNPSEQRTLIVPPAGDQDLQGGLFPRIAELKSPYTLKNITATVIFYYYDSENKNIRRATYSYIPGIIKHDISGKQTDTWKLV